MSECRPSSVIAWGGIRSARDRGGVACARGSAIFGAMKNRQHALVGAALACAFLLVNRSARAEIDDTSRSLRAGQLSLAAGFQAGFVADTHPLLVNVHEAIGLAGGLDLYARQAIGLDEQPLYLGAGIRWTLVSGRRNRVGVGLFAGGHLLTDNGGAGADGTLLVDYSLGKVTPYGAFDLNINFRENDTDTQVGLIGGVRIFMVQNVYWLVEGGLGLAGQPKPHFISTGPRIYL